MPPTPDFMYFAPPTPDFSYFYENCPLGSVFSVFFYRTRTEFMYFAPPHPDLLRGFFDDFFFNFKHYQLRDFEKKR